MPNGLYLLAARPFELIYPADIRQQIEVRVEMVAPPQTGESVTANPEILANVELVFSGWGCPVFSTDLLNYAPKLKAIFYGAGSIRYLTTDAFWERNIFITSAYQANDIPVGEFGFAQIILALKRYWHHINRFKDSGIWFDHLPVAGSYGSTIGLVSLGMIGSMVAKHLQSLAVKVIAYDPYVSPQKAAECGVTLCSLQEVFRQADVVSLHTPWLPETEGLITGELVASMKEGATLINKARGAIVKEGELAEVLRKRPDLLALLDVTWPEPPETGSALMSLPNVIISPHIAGSMDGECRRNGQYVVDELKRYLKGEPLQFAITREKAAIMA